MCERGNPPGYSQNFALIAPQRKSHREAVAKASLQRVLTSLGDAVLVPLLAKRSALVGRKDGEWRG